MRPNHDERTYLFAVTCARTFPLWRALCSMRPSIAMLYASHQKQLSIAGIRIQMEGVRCGYTLQAFDPRAAAGYTPASTKLGTMKQPTLASKFVRFGIYEVDLRTSELRKQGRKIRLQEQPCRILAILLEQRAEVVTREELRNRLRSHDTFPAFNHILNTPII